MIVILTQMTGATSRGLELLNHINNYLKKYLYIQFYL